MKRSWLLIPFFALFMSCGGDVGGDGYLVGGQCDNDRDCEEFCVKKKDFPEGMCTVDCKSDNDCPGGTVCIDKEGGVCAYQCEENVDCRRSYVCDREDRKKGGSEFVCIGK